ncbi:MAG: hypothetical protein R3B99_25400 [Polyangiales bacterium]
MATLQRGGGVIFYARFEVYGDVAARRRGDPLRALRGVTMTLQRG